MQGALDKFRVDAEQILTPFFKNINSQLPPPVIYHYTNDAGLKDILETGKIWLSDVFCLNDPSELSHGFSIFIESLKSRAATGPPECRKFAESIYHFQDGIRDSAQYFICSFSARGDDLGQWRAYADNGRGYALGFDAKILETTFAEQECGPKPNSDTFPVIYDDAKLADLHRNIVDKMFDLICLPHGRDISEAVLRAYRADLAVLTASYAMHASLYFKHESYKNEQEYRFLRIHEAGLLLPDMKLRTRPDGSVKFIEFDWKDATQGALQRIVVGPAAEFTKASRFAKDCVSMFNAGTVSIGRSSIPYRGSS